MSIRASLSILVLFSCFSLVMGCVNIGGGGSNPDGDARTTTRAPETGTDRDTAAPSTSDCEGACDNAEACGILEELGASLSDCDYFCGDNWSATEADWVAAANCGELASEAESFMVDTGGTGDIENIDGGGSSSSGGGSSSSSSTGGGEGSGQGTTEGGGDGSGQGGPTDDINDLCEDVCSQIEGCGLLDYYDVSFADCELGCLDSLTVSDAEYVSSLSCDELWDGAEEIFDTTGTDTGGSDTGGTETNSTDNPYSYVCCYNGAFFGCETMEDLDSCFTDYITCDREPAYDYECN